MALAISVTYVNDSTSNGMAMALASRLETSFLALWLKKAVPSWIATLLEMLVIYLDSATRAAQELPKLWKQ